MKGSLIFSGIITVLVLIVYTVLAVVITISAYHSICVNRCGDNIDCELACFGKKREDYR